MRKAIAICSRKAECDGEGFFHEKIRLLLSDTVKRKYYIYLLEKKDEP
jgi:hypothetical protein